PTKSPSAGPPWGDGPRVRLRGARPNFGRRGSGARERSGAAVRGDPAAGTPGGTGARDRGPASLATAPRAVPTAGRADRPGCATAKAGDIKTVAPVLGLITPNKWQEIAARTGRLLLGGLRVRSSNGHVSLQERAGLLIDLPLDAPISSIELVAVGTTAWLAAAA